jgi:hypothetical protein
VVDRVDAVERAAHRVRVAHVADHQLRLRREPGGRTPLRAVDLRVEVVEDTHPVAAREQRVDQVAAHETGAAGHQDGTFRHASPLAFVITSIKLWNEPNNLSHWDFLLDPAGRSSPTWSEAGRRGCAAGFARRC